MVRGGAVQGGSPLLRGVERIGGSAGARPTQLRHRRARRRPHVAQPRQLVADDKRVASGVANSLADGRGCSEDQQAVGG